ncbi:hypothetical protein [Fluviicola sp.]|uniref:hypothetical protein n=1 Tax=Fluviicola sp. TaxID=1917219 RepID=UPI0031DF0618
MIKTTLQIALLTAVLFSCTSGDETRENQHKLEIGDYTFSFPKEYKLVKEQGMDSDVGRITNGKISFHFDFGYYSNSLDQSLDEFLSEEVWKWNALGTNHLLSTGNITEATKDMRLIRYQTTDSVHYRLFFLHKSDTIHYDLEIPADMRKVKITTDTIDQIYYKFVRSETYAGLYAKDLKSYSKSINSYKSLSILADKLNSREVEECFKILQTCKPKK